jgi:hypothetical protein
VLGWSALETGLAQLPLAGTGFRAALLVAAGIVVAAVVLTALFSRGSRPATAEVRPQTRSGTIAAEGEAR